MAQADPTEVAAVLRALASASNAVRLYPPTSDLPTEALERFVALTEDASKVHGHLRYVVEPNSFTWGETSLGRDNAQIEALAQALYSHQVGQLVIVPGVTLQEARTFVEAIGRDKAEVKDAGGLTKALVSEGVSNIAVVEMSVRASQEDGMKGVDLLAAPLEEVGMAVVTAAERWAMDPQAPDEAMKTIGELPAATQEIASGRITEALLRLDEQTRVRVLANARKRDPSGKPMEGMLKIIGQMSPAALSRLLSLAAQAEGRDPLSLLPELELPPEAFRLLSMMLSPSPQNLAERGVPAQADHVAMATDIARSDEEEEADLERQIRESSPKRAAGRALGTACMVATSHPDADSVKAIGDALEPALRAGALSQVGQALDLLDDLAQGQGLVDEVAVARRHVADPELLADACAVLDGTVPPETLAKIIAASGDVGYDVLATCWTSANPARRELLRPVLARVGDRLVIAASRVARGGDTPRAREAITLLAALKDSRALPALGQLLQHDDKAVRVAALTAMAEIGGAEAGRSLSAALSHADEDTRIAAAREIGRAEVHEALTGLVQAVEKYHLVERDAAFKTEVIRSIVRLRAVEALPAFKRVVTRGWAFGAGNRVVRDAARQAIDTLKS